MPTLVVQLVEHNRLESDLSANVWLLADNKTIIAQSTEVEPADISQWMETAQGDSQSIRSGKLDLIILPPSHRAHVHLLKVNKGQAKYLDETVPVLMESRLGQSIEDTHFASKLVDTEQVLICAVSRQHMTIWQELMSDIEVAKKYIICPHVFLYSLLGELEYVSFLNETYRQEKDHIFSIPTALQVEPPQSSQTLDIDFLAQSLEQWKSWQGVDLLRGEFAIKSPNQGFAKAYKVSALVVALGVLVACLGLNYQTSVNRAQATYIEKEGKSAFLKLAPDEGRVINLRRQIEGRLRTLASNKPTNNALNSPYAVLSKIEEAKKNTPGEHSPDLIAYRDGVYILEWMAKDQETLDKLRQSLQKVKLDAYLDQVILKDKQYVGSYRIQGGL